MIFSSLLDSDAYMLKLHSPCLQCLQGELKNHFRFFHIHIFPWNPIENRISTVIHKSSWSTPVRTMALIHILNTSDIWNTNRSSQSLDNNPDTICLSSQSNSCEEMQNVSASLCLSDLSRMWTTKNQIQVSFLRISDN